MNGIDNNFVNKYIGYKKDGISNAELAQIKKDATAQAFTTEGTHSLTREIIRDGKIDGDEQKVLQAIGQGAKDLVTAQKYANSIDPTNSQISKLIMLGFKNKIQPTTYSQDVSKMGNSQKIIEAFKGSLKYVTPELRVRLEQMLTPQNLAIMGGVLAAYTSSHAVGVGFIADGILFGLGAIALGKDAIDVAKKLGGFASNSINAKTPQDLDNASRQLGSAMATVISDIPALIGIKNTKISSKTVGIPVPNMRPAMTASGGAVLVAATKVIIVTGQVVQLTKAQKAAIGATVMMASGNSGGSKVSSSGGNKTSKTGVNGVYEDAPYHSNNGNAVKSKKPIDGQKALNESRPLGGDSKRRIAYVNNEIVILDQTSVGKFHVHVRQWSELTDKMKNILITSGLFKINGKPI